MPKPTSVFSPSDPDPELLHSAALARRVILALVAALALLCVLIRLILPPARMLAHGWQFMNADAAFCVLFSALSLHLSEPSRSGKRRALSLLLAALVALLAGAALVEYRFHISLGIDLLTGSGQANSSLPVTRMSPQAAGGFELLGLAIVLLQMRPRFAARLADPVISLLGLLVLITVSGYLFGVLPMFGLAGSIRTSPLTVFCLFLLAAATLLRRAESGVFSILLGRGIGGRIARLFSPLLLVLPFLREAGRAHLIQANRLPANDATAIFASLNVVLALALLLFIAWRINGMEGEIHDLSLRDELTGLYNLRGFQLLAEQALRLAQRSKVPFSVLFIDLDNLKQINDMHGHSAGSATLCETAELLQQTFRETDVLGRIGGDEFAVAGQFSPTAISVAMERLREASAHRNAEHGHRFPLSFSMGHVTTEPSGRESLRALVSRADQAMYEEKRRKKSDVA
jgi:diguanylate cyclase (GGDEF)-like protein